MSATTTTKNLIVAFFLILGFLPSGKANAQCTVQLNNGKSVTFQFTPIQIIANNCGQSWGYNYDHKIQYTATVNGQVTFWWVGATFQSGDNNNFDFGLDNSKVAAGSGTIITANNQGRYVTDCGTATPGSLNIRNLLLTISSSEGNISNFPCAFAASGTPNSTSGSNTSSQNGIAPLPVKLISFDGAINNGKVDLTWVTATETDNAYFILERSADAKSWNNITKMDGAGTTRYNTTYNYTDELPAAGMNYYRLKQVDANGAATYSRIIAVKAEDHASANTITLYPNPNNGENVHFTGMENAADWSVKVLNTSSAIVDQSATASAELTLPAMPAGLYFVQLQNTKTGEAQILKLMKK